MPDPREMQGCVLSAGGGTGGHIYPAVAVAEALADIAPRVAHRFIVSPRPIDATVMGGVRLAGQPATWHAIPAHPMIPRPRALWRFVTHWGEGVRAVRALIRAARAEHGSVVLAATGGFVAAPAAQAARVERCPLVLINLDAVPGKANRAIARHADVILSAAPTGRPTWEEVPPIVRRDARPPGDRAACRALLGLPPTARVLMVTGGSQGAGTINDLCRALVADLGPELRQAGWHVLHQCGRDAATPLIECYQRAGIPARVEEFVRGMGAWWGAADVAISRAGAGSVAEAWAAGTPTIFMPYPFHRDQHQARNAARLVSVGAAMLVADRIDPAATLAHDGAAIREVLLGKFGNPGDSGEYGDLGDSGDLAGSGGLRRGMMLRALADLGPADGAERVARVLANALHHHGGPRRGS